MVDKKVQCHFHWDHIYPKSEVAFAQQFSGNKTPFGEAVFVLSCGSFPQLTDALTLSTSLTSEALCNPLWCNAGKLWRHGNADLIAALGGLLRRSASVNQIQSLLPCLNSLFRFQRQICIDTILYMLILLPLLNFIKREKVWSSTEKQTSKIQPNLTLTHCFIWFIKSKY